MSHPEDLLAEYVDGTLADRERTAVDAHLAGCDRCREEISLTRASRASLRRLPELEAPVGSVSRALREARVPGAEREAGRTRVAAAARPPRWARWVPAAAAAALIGLLVLTVPRIGDHAVPAASVQNPFRKGAEAAGGASGPVAPSAASSAGAQNALDQLLSAGVRLEHRDRNYTAADIQQLTDANATRYLGAAVPRRPNASDGAPQFALLARGNEAKAATACISSQVTMSPTDALVELIEADYEGAPAYFAVFVESPAAGDPVNEVIVWVVRKDGCTIANFAYRKL
jgi:anti-sigma factor RsiW